MATSHASDMPTVPFGPHRVSRLILGANPINGGSHLSRFVNLQMKRYFTGERVQELLSRCVDEGINTWQSGSGNLAAYREFRARGGTMHFISLGRDDPEQGDEIARLVDAGAIGIAHHGEVTDRFWKSGEIERARDYCRKVRDSGAMVGVSTHMPDVIDHVVSAGWDVDFFMCCVYERHRSREELKALLGKVPIPVPEVYLEEDPPRMFAAMKSTDKPCLAFKILAAGRLCERPETVERAFEVTFAAIKPNDAVIIGIYPEYEDQVAINGALVRRYGGR